MSVLCCWVLLAANESVDKAGREHGAERSQGPLADEILDGVVDLAHRLADRGFRLVVSAHSGTFGLGHAVLLESRNQQRARNKVPRCRQLVVRRIGLSEAIPIAALQRSKTRMTNYRCNFVPGGSHFFTV